MLGRLRARPALGFGVLCTGIGLVVSGAFLLSFGRSGSVADPRVLWLPATIGSGVAGLTCWRLLAGATPSATRGAVAGAASAVIATYLMFWLLLSGHWLAQKAHLVAPVSDPIDPLAAIPGAAVFSFWGLLVTGWITVPLGGVAGAWWARALARRST